jgi:hypothetical protein
VKDEKLQFTAWSPLEFDKKYIYWEQPVSTDVKKFSIGKDGTVYISLFDLSLAKYVLYKITPDGRSAEIDSESYSGVVTLSALN